MEKKSRRGSIRLSIGGSLFKILFNGTEEILPAFGTAHKNTEERSTLNFPAIPIRDAQFILREKNGTCKDDGSANSWKDYEDRA